MTSNRCSTGYCCGNKLIKSEYSSQVACRGHNKIHLYARRKTKMQKKTWTKIVLTAMLALTPATSSWAACSTADLAGNWNVYMAAWDHAGTGGNWWGYVPLTVKATGAVQSGSTLSLSDPGTTAITGGTLRISSKCTVTGTISSKNGTLTIKNAAMDSGKTAISGVFQSPGQQDGIFNMLKH